VAGTLSTEATFVECLLIHSVKELAKGPHGAFLPSAGTEGTQQRVSLCRVSRQLSSKAPSPSSDTATTTFLAEN
jgi:hypothetical protein